MSFILSAVVNILAAPTISEDCTVANALKEPMQFFAGNALGLRGAVPYIVAGLMGLLLLGAATKFAAGLAKKVLVILGVLILGFPVINEITAKFATSGCVS